MKLEEFLSIVAVGLVVGWIMAWGLYLCFY
jgi:hypothetical protein